ncbi:hypothetical protein ACMD2_09024 [Ananas comosus]|uniref:Uncharacterized protein n=1 Tax=Ananas comosus TaxID=4615 RepID=A0A199VMM7_ANACO|nr:hypothetical protein ACMD2_09024 [Ananas comosus]
MFIVEFGIWVIPLTLILAPCRRFVALIAMLQQLHQSILLCPQFLDSPEISTRIARLNSMAFVLNFTIPL